MTADWCDADLVLCTSLCFTDVLVTGVQRRTRDLKPGARVVCMQRYFDEVDDVEGSDVAEGTTVDWLRPVHVRDEEPMHEVVMQMSFGDARFYVFERVGVTM